MVGPNADLDVGDHATQDLNPLSRYDQAGGVARRAPGAHPIQLSSMLPRPDWKTSPAPPAAFETDQGKGLPRWKGDPVAPKPDASRIRRLVRRSDPAGRECGEEETDQCSAGITEWSDRGWAVRADAATRSLA